MSRRGGRWGLLPILVLVNAAAIWGQAGWANDNLIGPRWDWRLVVAVCAGFAAAIELTGVFLANKADQAEDADIPAGGIRLGSYAVGLFSGALNFSHFSHVSFAAAVAFGFLSAISPFLWGIDSRVRRGRPVAPSRRFWHPVRSIALLRYAAWEGIADEEQALRAMAGQGGGAAPLHIDVDQILERHSITAEDLPIPISPAPTAAAAIERAPRAARTAYDVRRVAELAVDGTKAPQIHELTGASKATAYRFTKVAALLRANPRAEIDSTTEKVHPEHVSIMRELVTK